MQDIRFIFLLLISLILKGCIETFDISRELSEQNILVIEGVVTNKLNESNIVLSFMVPYKNGQTFKDPSVPATNASVKVVDSDGIAHVFSENAPGEYIPNDNQFIGNIGKSYKLMIELEDGQKYTSHEELMDDPVSINNLNIEYSQRDLMKNQEKFVAEEGYRLLVVAENISEQEKYVKCNYSEVWEVENWGITVVYKTYLQNRYIDWNWESFPNQMKNALQWPYDTLASDICYESNIEKRYLNVSMMNKNSELQIPVNFIHRTSSRFSRLYSINVELYTINSEVYNYFMAIAQQAEYTGSYFDPQPFKLTGNVYNPENINEIVCGYFMVAAKSEKRFFVEHDELPVMPLYVTSCFFYEVWVVDPLGLYHPYGWPDVWNLNSPCCFECNGCNRTGDKPAYWPR